MKRTENSSGQANLVVDIGGTWFRSAIVEATLEVSPICTVPAITVRSNTNFEPDVLRAKMVDFIADAATLARRMRPDIDQVGIVSIGAALDGRTGHVLASGPLWGDDRCRFDIVSLLSRRCPEFDWKVFNDVTAGLFAALHTYSRPNSTDLFSYVTISSGIALRTINIQTLEIPLHKNFGVQGEIGHVPCSFVHNGKAYERHCECGGSNHLSAFSAGIGIESLLSELFQIPKEEAWDVFRNGLCDDSPWARNFLSAVTRPLVSALLILLAVEPRISRLVMGGGVVSHLKPYWSQMIMAQLKEHGLYLISESPTYFDELIAFEESAANCLIGAVLAARASSRPAYKGVVL